MERLFSEFAYMDAILSVGACKPRNPVNEEGATRSVQRQHLSFLTLSELPDDVLVKHILPCMSFRDICACAQVNRRLRDIIDASHVNAISYCRNFCSSRITDKAHEKYQTVLRCWLHQFGQGGRELIVKLDQNTGNIRFPQLLFYSIAKTLGMAQKLAVSQAGSFDRVPIVFDILFSLDGINAITAFQGLGARLYRLVEGKWQLETVISPDSRVYKFMFSADSSQVITASSDNRIRLHKFVNNNWQEQTCLQNINGLYASAFSGQCQIALTGNNRIIVYGYDGAQWQQEYDKSGLDQCLPRVTFSPDGKYFVLACNNLSLYGLVDGKWRLQKTIPNSRQAPLFLFSSDGNRLLSAIRGRRLKIHHLAAGEWHELNTFRLSSEIINFLFTPDGQHVMLCLEKCSITFLSFVNGMWQINATMNHPNVVSAYAFSPNGAYAMTGCHDNTVRIFQQAGGQWQEKEQIKVDDRVLYAGFSPYGTHTHIAVTTEKDVATIYGLLKGQWHMKCRIPDVERGSEVRFSPIGGYLSIASTDKLNFFTLISD